MPGLPDRGNQVKVLITGVAGLLGSHLSRHLLDLGHQVYGIDDLSGGYRDFLHEDVDFLHTNLLDHASVERFCRINKPEVVYHLAAYAAEGLSPFIRRFNYQNNVVASANIINASIQNGVRKVIFTSSMAVYGSGDPPFRETDKIAPLDPYGIAKYAVETDLSVAQAQFGLDYTIVRPHNVVGIYQNIWDRYRNVIGIWIRQVLNGDPITIFGDGTQERAFSDIQFYLDPFAKLLTEGSREAFNIGADHYWPLNEVARVMDSVARVHGLRAIPKYLEARHEAHKAYCDHTKAKEHLGFKDETRLASTIAEMFEWAITQPKRQVRDIPIEINTGLYSFWK